MNIKARIQRFIQQSLGEIGTRFASALGIAVDKEVYKNWVFLCVDKIADTAAAADIRVMVRGRGQNPDREMESHKIDEIIKDRELLYLIFANAELYGNAYMIRGVEGPIFVPSKRVTPKIKKDYTGIESYEVTNEVGSRSVLQPDEILHYRYPNANSRFEGVGITEKIKDWIYSDNAITKFNRLFFEKGGKIGTIIKTEYKSQDQVEKTKEAWISGQEGLENAHKVAVLPSGVDVQRPDMSRKDMEFEKGTDKARDKILAAFGISKSIFGITEGGMSRADAEAKNYAFAAYTIDPKLRRFVEWLNKEALPRYIGNRADVYITFVPTGKEDKKLQLDTTRTGVANRPFMTINEARERHGLPALEGGDVLPEPTGVTVGSPLRKQAIEPYKQKTATATLAEQIMEGIKLATQDPYEFSEEEETKYEAEIKRIEEQSEASANEMERLIIRQNNALEQEVLENVRDYVASRGEQGLTEAPIPRLMDRARNENLMYDIMLPINEHVLQLEGVRRLTDLAPDKVFDVESKEIQRRLQIYTRTTAKSMTSTTNNEVRKAVARGIAEGEGIEKITARVNATFDKANELRANMTAKTATADASHEGAYQAMKQSGIVKTKVWYTQADERVDPEVCAPLHGTEIALDNEFFEEGDALGKGNATAFTDIAHPPIHPRCRCYLAVGQTT